MKKDRISIFWFRRDLRLDDNMGLYKSLQSEHPVLPIFIFDPEILDKLPKDDSRVSFIHQQLQKLHNQLQKEFQSGIAHFFDHPVSVFKKLQQEYEIHTVFTNHDYEPYAIKRDSHVHDFLKEHNISFETFKDQVVFEKDEIVKSDGDPYVVYTPYMKQWKAKFNPSTDLVEYEIQSKLGKGLYKNTTLPNLGLSDIGFEPSKIAVPDYHVSPNFIENYEGTRNYPAKEQGTSRLGPHLRFGTVSIREMIKKAIAEKNETFWNELIWREFFMQILWHFPDTVHKAFKPKYDRIEWRNNEREFELWKSGQTGYALVDAGMRQLNRTGYMHNRVRMLVASFLCKHLLIDWRWGEAYFAEKLLDYEMASNVGNWQWAAGSGVDAAPYFRIFNPMTQVDKFDAEKKYINQWVPELQELSYPQKMVDHKMARERCLKVYKQAVG
ncbi:deoxyribodipyrimidine photo-lyase [Muricauda sp. CAU 1633]|uniref:cryptochrome/photolyase family protein n=1 Tax=Allomuricauda sp. CAU 1633 TaxID=2816036 RepID=UPI001A8D094F|nr:deoxyribodipyrimidine photo-lyase [Muricauda sp. CAU 1633]MBO0323420.1 deoxyribodipyrimidine photo-lyase [Muricauda sp. CAU 1633]